MCPKGTQSVNVEHASRVRALVARPLRATDSIQGGTPMTRPRAIGRKLLLAPVLSAALVVLPLQSGADEVSPDQLGQRMSGGKANVSPAGNPPDKAGPPAGAGSGRKIR